MMGTETMTYTLCGFFCGLSAKLPIHKKFYESSVTAYFGSAREPLISAVIVIVTFVIATSISAVYAPSEQIKNMSITEVISDE